MKKDKILRLLIVSFLLMPSVGMILMYFYSQYELTLIKVIQGVELYIDDKYEDAIKDECYTYAYNSAKTFFPECDTFDYKDNIHDFVIFDGTKTISYDLSILLELKFESDEKLNEFLEYEYARFSYSYIMKYNNYVIKLVDDEDINLYKYKSDKPYICGLLCINNTSYTVSYIIFYELYGMYVNYNDIFKSVGVSV